jgi:hypothetical protein
MLGPLRWQSLLSSHDESGPAERDTAHDEHEDSGHYVIFLPYLRMNAASLMASLALRS